MARVYVIHVTDSETELVYSARILDYR